MGTPTNNGAHGPFFFFFLKAEYRGKEAEEAKELELDQARKKEARLGAWQNELDKEITKTVC